MEISSTFKTTLDEFCEVANWMTQNIYNWRSLDSDLLNQIKNKLDALKPIADKYDHSFRTTKVILENELYLKLENASSSLWNAISITIKTEQQTTIVDSNKGKEHYDDNNMFLLCSCKLFACVLFSISDALINSLETKIRTFSCRVNTLKCVMDCSTQEFLKFCSRSNGEIDTELEHNYNLSKVKEGWYTLLKICQDLPELALKSLEDHHNDYTQVQDFEINKLKMEYFLINFQICLKGGDIETAKLYSSKVNIKGNPSIVDANSIIEICRIIFNSILIYSKKYHENYEKYEVVSLLKLALEYLELPIQDLTSHVNYQNVKYSVTLFLTKFAVENYPHVLDENDCDLLIGKIQEEFTKKTEPYKLAIKYNQLKKIENCDSIIQEIIMRMITNLNITIHWEKILECIGQLSSENTNLAIVCLEYIFINKLNQQENTEIWENLIVSRVFMTIESKDMTIDDVITSLEIFFKLVESKAVSKLSKIKISCIVTLLWNLGKRLDKKEEYDKSCKVYELAQKGLFCDDFSDIGKVKRALMSSYINCHNYNTGLQQYENMSENDKMHPLTQLLLVKIYVNERSIQKIIECFDNICRSEEKHSIQILILAISLCKKLDDLIISGINILFDMLENRENELDKNSDKDYQVPLLELVRYTIQLTIKLLEDDSSSWGKYFATFLSLLTKAKTIVSQSLTGPGPNFQNNQLDDKSISVDEIEWFASIAYNISVKGYNEKKYADVLSVIQVAIEFNKMISVTQFSFPKQFYYQHWNYRTIFLKTRILLAFSQQNEQLIPQVGELLVSLDKIFEELNTIKNNVQMKEKMNEENLIDLSNCNLELLTLQFQCILLLKNQQKMQIFIEKILEYRDSKIDKILIELCSNNPYCPSGITRKVITSIIKRNLIDNSVSNNDLCLWTRILLEDVSNSGETTYEVIVSNILKKFQLDSLNDNTCLIDCKENIEIVSTLIWNIGVNLIISDNKESAIKWCKHSIKFAGLVNNGLESQLKNMWDSLISNTGIEEDKLLLD